MSKNRRLFDTTIQLLFWEAAFAYVYNQWSGPNYLSGLAGEMKASVGIVGLFSASVWVGSIIQLISVWVYRPSTSPKHFTLLFVILSRSIWAAPVTAALIWAYNSRDPAYRFPVTSWFYLVTAVTWAIAILGAVADNGWMTWVSGVVPADRRGRFFGTRKRFTVVALIAADLLASVIIGWQPRGFKAGYAALGILAMLAALASTTLLALVPDAARTAAAKLPAHARQHPLAAIAEPFKDRWFRQPLLFGTLFTFAMQLSSPYFNYYFTGELGIQMSHVAMWAVCRNIGSLVAAGYIGRYIDRTRDPARLMRVAVCLMAASPLAYLGSARSVEWISPVEQFINGGAWAGFWLSMLAWQFDAAPRAGNFVYFAVFTATTGVAGILGNFAGASLSEWLRPWGGFRALWVLSSGVRYLVIVWALLIPYSLRRIQRRPAAA